MEIKDRISRVLEHWFIGDPALFTVLCSHEIVQNCQIACPVRTGMKKIEYNPAFLNEMTDDGLEEALRTEAVRILLKHPYERKPDQCSNQAIAIGSNLVIGDNYRFGKFNIEKPADYDLKNGQPYEWYSRQIQMLLPPGGGGEDSDNKDGSAQSKGNGQQSCGQGGARDDERMEELRDKAMENAERNTDLSQLWEEDELACEMINGIIERTKNWGSLAGNFAEMIQASTKAKINWRNAFAGFRASVLSSKRKLTRMRPNRRTGFDQMGSIRRFNTRLLVAVDVSGSITSENLEYFYGVINSAFKYGFEAIDVIEFDCGITSVKSLKKKMKEVKAIGRGGTSFDEPIMYAHLNGYDGLVMLTDGYAPEPIIPDGFRCKIIWVCQDKESYNDCERWMRKSGRVTIMELT